MFGKRTLTTILIVIVALTIAQLVVLPMFQKNK